MSYRKIMIDSDNSVLMDFMKALCPELSENAIIRLGISFAVVIELAAEMEGEVIAKFGGHSFDLMEPKNIKVLLTDALALLKYRWADMNSG